MDKNRRTGLAIALATVGLSGPASAENLRFPALYNSYGVPGLIDLPSGLSATDGELAITSSYFQNQLRTTLTFQITPRLTASFRYANLYDISLNQDEGFRFDRSLSLSYRITDEGVWRPAVTVGLNDFLGTGIYGSEYIVATKHLSPTLRLTGGIGWGRLAGVNSFSNPLSVFDDRFDGRVDNQSGLGGDVRFNHLFTGPAALFGGVEWQATDDLTLVAEYSSDAYPFEDGYAFDRRSPVNVGLNYRVSDRLNLAARYLYGSEVGMQLTYAIDPARPSNGSGLGGGPPACAAPGVGPARERRVAANAVCAGDGRAGFARVRHQR